MESRWWIVPCVVCALAACKPGRHAGPEPVPDHAVETDVADAPLIEDATDVEEEPDAAMTSTTEDGVPTEEVELAGRPSVGGETQTPPEHGEAPPLWDRTYGTLGRETLAAVVARPDGGYVFLGTGKRPGEQVGDVILTRIAADGELEGSKAFGGKSDEIGRDLCPLPDGGYAFLAETSSRGKGLYDYWLVRTNKKGKIVWNRTFGGKLTEEARALVCLRDGGFVIGGNSQSEETLNKHAWIVRTDEKGRTVWSHTYGDHYVDNLADLTLTPAGRLVFAGTVSGEPPGTGKRLPGSLRVVAIDLDGEMLWERTFDRGASEDMFGYQGRLVEAVAALEDDSIVVAGSHEPTKGDHRVLVMKLDSEGELLWEHTHSPTGLDRAYDVASLPDGLALVGAAGPTALLVLTGPDGTSRGHRTFGAKGKQLFDTVLPLDGGTLLMGGSRIDAASRTPDIWIVTYAPQPGGGSEP